MNSKNILLLTGIILSLGFTIAMQRPTSAADARSFDPGNIIDDAVFTNKDSMTVAQIQAFLDSKVNCDTMGKKRSELGGGTRAQWLAANGISTPITCINGYFENPSSGTNNYGKSSKPAGSISAAQIIYNYSRQYSINPQTIIVTLQKENGLITDEWPTPRQYTQAMGFGCPDNVAPGAPACDPTYKSFSTQVYQAARHFRGYIDNDYCNGNWCTPKTTGNNTILWSPTAACGSSVVSIKNRATVALYSYTPYRPNQAALNAGYGTGDGCSAYGNRNFYLYFNDWFGSTKFVQPTGGALYSQQSTGKLYLVTGRSRFYIPNWSTMVNYGLDSYAASTISDASLATYEDSGTLTNLIWNNSGVFLVNNKKKYHMTADMCATWGVDCFDGHKVKQLDPAFDTGYLSSGGSLGSLTFNNGIYYKIQNGKKHPFLNVSSLQAAGYNTNQALSVNEINATQPLGPLQISTPGVVRFSTNPTAYYFDGTTYFKIPNMLVYNDWKFGAAPNFAPPASTYDQTPPTSKPLGSWITSGGSKYVIDQGRKLIIPSSLSSLWPDSQYTNSMPIDWFNKLPTETLSQLVWSDPRIYLLNATGKHYVSTYEDYVSFQKKYPTTSDLRPDKLTSTTQGVDAISDGQIVSLSDGTGRIFVVNNGKLTYIPNAAIFDAYGLNWSAIREYPVSIQTSYPIDTSVLGSTMLNNGTYYINSKSSLYQLSPSLAHDFGVKPAKFSQSSEQVSKKIPPVLSRFLYNEDNGRIYYASGGAIHYVATYEAFVGYGGLRTPASSVTNATIDLFNIGQSI